jgi:hypothetical protein
MDTGTLVGYFLGGALLLGIGVLIIVLTIVKGFMNPNPPDITMTVSDGNTSSTSRPGRGGLWFFIILGLVFGISGIVLLIRGIIAATSHT